MEFGRDFNPGFPANNDRASRSEGGWHGASSSQPSLRDLEWSWRFPGLKSRAIYQVSLRDQEWTQLRVGEHVPVAPDDGDHCPGMGFWCNGFRRR